MRIIFAFLCVSFSVHAASFRVCEFAPLPNALAGQFQHPENNVFALFTPYHSANDVITVFGREAALEGKFSYGTAAKDLEGEIVEVWVDDCHDKYTLVHRGVTNKRGRLLWSLPTDFLKEPGEYKIWLRVVGDNTGVPFTLRVVPPASKVAVFDIDGTLTAHEEEVNLEVISKVVGGNFSPPTRAFAAEVSNLLRDRGYEIVYLSGRHYFLTDLTRAWLDRNNFAPGTLIVAQRFKDVFPKIESVGKYKLGELLKMTKVGLYIGRAYGNATTDIYAYDAAKIDLDRIFIVGKHSGAQGTRALGSNFQEHYTQLVNAENV